LFISRAGRAGPERTPQPEEDTMARHRRDLPDFKIRREAVTQVSPGFAIVDASDLGPGFRFDAYLEMEHKGASFVFRRQDSLRGSDLEFAGYRYISQSLPKELAEKSGRNFLVLDIHND
jgi:hypothetical protein